MMYLPRGDPQAEVSEDLHIRTGGIFEANMLELDVSPHICQHRTIISARVNPGLPIENRENRSS